MSNIDADFDNTEVLDHYPTIESDKKQWDKWDKRNPAIKLYGRRFYKDQTPIEYLAEFLLVFCSPKDENDSNTEYRFTLSKDKSRVPGYYPKTGVPLKLFAFFPTSKLETRHPVHRAEYLKALGAFKDAVSGTPEQQDEAVRLVQSLLSGFVGVAKDRTWVTYTFLPAATALITREVTWQHPQALKEGKGPVKDWRTSEEYFDSKTRNFFGRGGELLFLQLVHLFSEPCAPEILSLLGQEHYLHLKDDIVEQQIPKLQRRLENSLRDILQDSVAQFDGLVRIMEHALNEFELRKDKEYTELAWVPKSTRTEALLFAIEMDNICSLKLSSLEKIDFLRILFCLQVMRSLCFQARRVDKQSRTTLGFAGHYAWICCNSSAHSGDPARRMAETSCTAVESMLFRSIRSPILRSADTSFSEKDFQNGDDNTFRHFRKFGKEIGLIVPRHGRGQRFALPPELLRFFVAALVRPGEHVRLTEFYSRVFAHYGIALGGEPLSTALDWSGGGSGAKGYGIDVSTAWVEEALQQGGFLIELSDAVSIVHNPGSAEGRA